MCQARFGAGGGALVAFTLLDLGSLTWDSKGDQSVPSKLLARFSSAGLACLKCLVDVHYLRDI